MPVRVVKLPDVGEGIAEAELVEWHVSVGDRVTTETVLADVMTDKATVEISAPVSGTITFLTGSPGDVLSIGSDFVGIDTDGVTGSGAIVAAAAPAADAAAAPVEDAAAPVETEPKEPAPTEPVPTEPVPTEPAATEPAVSESAPRAARAHQRPPAPALRPIASPAVRQRARELGVDLRLLRGSAPAGRITHADLDAYLAQGAPRPAAGSAIAASDATRETKIVGLRRRIAERMSLSASRIPHITYVDEIDMTALEALRAELNRDVDADEPRLTILPFLCRAIVRAVGEQPHVGATFDDESGVLTTYDAVHIGIATQTDNGLVVPVVRHAETLDLWACAAEIGRLSSAARSGSATRAELSGSTITITSLGALGGLVTTPIINHPEVAIIGVNKLQVRPVWDGHTFEPRTMMNLSSSFDHRIIDGWDAATFVQRIKELLELPALLFIDG